MVLTAVRSALDQTCAPREVIVVDDASDDDTPDLIARIKNPRVKRIRLERNVGGAAARNIGVAAATSDFVAFLDSDDWWLPKKLELHLKSVRESYGQVFYSRNYTAFGDRAVEQAGPYHEGEVLSHLAGGWCPPTTSSFVISRLLFRTVQFDEELPGFQDYDLWVQLALSGRRFSLVDLPLTVFLHHAESRLSSSMTRRLLALEQVHTKWAPEFSARSLGDSFDQAIQTWRWLTKFSAHVDETPSSLAPSRAHLLKRLPNLELSVRAKCRYAAYLLLGRSFYQTRFESFVQRNGVDVKPLRPATPLDLQ